MTWGVLLISLFLLGAFACGVMLLMKRQPPRALEAVVAVPAVGVSIYTGVLLSTAPAFPLWNIVALPAAFVVSAAYCGYAVFSLVDRFAGEGDVSRASLVQKVALVLPLLGVAFLAVLFAVVSATQGSGALAVQASIASLVSGANALFFWGGVVLIGLVAPLALALVRKKQGDEAPAWMGVAEWICILVGGFAFRYVIVVAAVPIFG